MKWILAPIALLFSTVLFAQTTPLTGRTTGRLPYLEYGPGDDRLGGAKMTYLDTAVFIKVIDSVKDDYKVQLSAQHTAYLPKQNFKWDSTTAAPYYLTSSFKVWGDELYDYVSIALPERLPYRSKQEIAPGRIVVDIFVLPAIPFLIH